MKLLTEKERSIYCIETQEQPPTLVIETLENGVWIFDWTHFSHAVFHEHSDTLARPKIIILFYAHDVILEGKNLKFMVTALARMEISKIREYPEKYDSLAEGHDVYIHKVEIEERPRGW